MISSILPIPGGHQGYRTPPSLYLGEESVLQHLPEAGSCCGVGEQQAPQEGSGTGREAGGQRVPCRADAPIQLLPSAASNGGLPVSTSYLGGFGGVLGAQRGQKPPHPPARSPPYMMQPQAQMSEGAPWPLRSNTSGAM